MAAVGALEAVAGVIPHFVGVADAVSKMPDGIIELPRLRLMRSGTPILFLSLLSLPGDFFHLPLTYIICDLLSVLYYFSPLSTLWRG